jgi:hypothetical protein
MAEGWPPPSLLPCSYGVRGGGVTAWLKLRNPRELPLGNFYQMERILFPLLCVYLEKRKKKLYKLFIITCTKYMWENTLYSLTISKFEFKI